MASISFDVIKTFDAVVVHYSLFTPIFFMKIKFLTYLLAILLIPLFSLSSCSDDDNKDGKSNTETLFLFFPYSNLEDYIEGNINSLKNGIVEREGMDNWRIIVFQALTPQKANLYEISYSEGVCKEEMIEHGMLVSFNGKDKEAAKESLRKVMDKVTAHAPSEKYSMVIGCHGAVWLPSGVTSITDLSRLYAFGTASSEYQIDNTIFANVLKEKGIKLESLIFDACYMSNIETIYDFKDICKYYISSAAEVMNAGIPYNIVVDDILRHNYQNIVKKFVDYYRNSQPYAAMAVVDCGEIEKMAGIVKTINSSDLATDANLNDIQRYDNMYAPIYYDFNHYFSEFCKSESLKAEFRSSLARLILYSEATDYVYTSFGNDNFIRIFNSCGVNTSQPTFNTKALPLLQETAWWKATHE